jgi:phosphoribosylglycinamide formyltransferase-1
VALIRTQVGMSKARQARLVKICKALPEASVEPAGKDHLAFRINKRIFAYYLFDHHGDGKIAFCCKSTLNDQRRHVREDPDHFFVPAYLGPKGWIAIRLDLEDVDWEIVGAFAKSAYQALAPRKLAALVD